MFTDGGQRKRGSSAQAAKGQDIILNLEIEFMEAV